jgi:hypothetical protein
MVGLVVGWYCLNIEGGGGALLLGRYRIGKGVGRVELDR